MSRPECAYGPVIRISSLAARNPSPLRPRGLVDQRLAELVEVAVGLRQQRRVRAGTSRAPARPAAARWARRPPCRRCPTAPCRSHPARGRPRRGGRSSPCRRTACPTRRRGRADPCRSASGPARGPSCACPGASMHSRATQAFRSVSPIPVMPSSVCTSTTMSSWFELVASRSYPGSSRMWQSTPVIFMRCASCEARGAGRSATAASPASRFSVSRRPASSWNTGHHVLARPHPRAVDRGAGARVEPARRARPARDRPTPTGGRAGRRCGRRCRAEPRRRSPRRRTPPPRPGCADAAETASPAPPSTAPRGARRRPPARRRTGRAARPPTT